MPPIQGILRSQETGVDPFDDSTLEEWRARLETIFSRIVEVNPQIDHIRYIGQNGDELVRVNNEVGNPRIVPIPELQNKAHRPYFQEGMKIAKDEVYISPLELNVEHGIIETPHKPVLRIATPVFDDTSIQGVIVVNIQLTEIFDFISMTPIGQIIVADENGDFILHADEEKRFSSQLGTNFNLFTEHPELKQNILEKDSEDYYDQHKKEFLIWKKIKYSPSDENRYWTILSVIDEESLLAPIKQLMTRSILIALIAISIASFLILLIVSRILRPLVTLTDIINEISQGNTGVTIDSSLKKNNNEIGKLAQAFDRTIVSLKLAIEQTSKSEEDSYEDKEESEEKKKNEEKKDEAPK